MSRFFGTASDSDTESEVSEEEIIQRPAVLPTYTVIYTISTIILNRLSTIF